MIERRRVYVLIAVFLWQLAGCASYLKTRELERVARDWALTIRASQVIPVYPLTEDLQPGDVFLVRTPIPVQHEEYSRRGFLPLDQHLTRLQGLDFRKVYDGSFGIGDHRNTPRHWQFPPDGTTWASRPASGVDGAREEEDNEPAAPVELEENGETVDDTLNPGEASEETNESAEEEAEEGEEEGEGSDGERPTTAPSSGATKSGSDERHRSPTNWHLAPRAGFPTYTFEVRSGAGVSVAVPIQGVPVGLSLMQSDRATGSVTIADAYTYAVPYDELIDKIQNWASQSRNRHFLRQVRQGVVDGESCFDRCLRWFTGDPPPTVYLRLVHRVYLTGRVMVELTNAETGSLKATGGDEKDVQLEVFDGASASQGYVQALKAVSQAIDATVPGGTLKLAWATRRSVAMSETFDRPLVIGFLGFDFPVLPDGDLGVPIATLNQLESGTLVPTTELPVLETHLGRATLRLLYTKITEDAPTDPEVDALKGNLDALAAALPEEYPVPVYLPGGTVETDAGSGPNLVTIHKKESPVDRSSFDSVITYWGQLEQSAAAIEEALGGASIHIDRQGDDPRAKDLPEVLLQTDRELERLRKDVGGDPVVGRAFDVQLLKRQ